MQQIQLAFLGATELIIILIIVIVIFGASRIPKLGESLGKGIKNFRKSFKDSPQEIEGQARRVEEKGELPPKSASEEPAKEKEAVNTVPKDQ